ncbi:MAG: acylphosphatase [Rhodospirillaceae bacterium]|nr:acylphosphatase [Rhodospirillaceae bacterium]
MSDKTVHVRIEGRVQGVFYRAWTSEQALSRGLAGWVRNMRDGSVEALFSGPAADVDDMLTACRSGPPLADVTKISPIPCEAPETPGFHKLPTA